MIKIIKESYKSKLQENNLSDVTAEFINGLNPELKNKPDKLIKLAQKLKSITQKPEKRKEYDLIISELRNTLDECTLTEAEDLSMDQIQLMIGKELYDLLSMINPVDQIYLDIGSTDFSGRVQDVPWNFSKSIIQNISYDANKKLYQIVVK